MALSITWTDPTEQTAVASSSTRQNEDVLQNILYLKNWLHPDAATELTIATGAVTVTRTYHKIDTQGDAVTDDLDSMAGGSEGKIVILRPENDARTVIVKNNPTGGAGYFDIGGDIYLDDIDDHAVFIYGNDTYWHLIACIKVVKEFTVNAFQYPAPGTDWTPALTGAGLAASKSAKKVWLPLNFLKIGDQIISYKLVGDATEAAALTLDCKLVSVNKANPLTTTDVTGGGITQVTADGNFDSEAVLTALEVVVTDKQYVLEILGTTGVGDSITVIGAEVKLIRLI